MSAIERPRVSVLLPVRNGMPWLPAAIASLQAQTFTDFELIVLEDGSTDATPAFLSAVVDSRVRTIATGGAGIAAALNAGLAAARGVYVARQDADDESLPERLARQVAVLETRRDIDVVATCAEYVDAQGAVVENDWTRVVRAQQDVACTPAAIAELMPLTCCVTHGSIVARTAVLQAAGGYRPEMVPAEDYDLWLRLLPSHRFLKLDTRLYRYRIHGGQTATGARARQTTMAVLAKLQYLRRRCGHLPAPARLAITGGGPGAAIYRAVARAAGFELTDSGRSWDVLAVTDFSSLASVGERLALADGASTDRLGNFFVRRDESALRVSA